MDMNIERHKGRNALVMAAGTSAEKLLLFIFHLGRNSNRFHIKGNAKILQLLEIHVYLAFGIELVVVIIPQVLEWYAVPYDVIDGYEHGVGNCHLGPVLTPPDHES